MSRGSRGYEAGEVCNDLAHIYGDNPLPCHHSGRFFSLIPLGHYSLSIGLVFNCLLCSCFCKLLCFLLLLLIQFMGISCILFQLVPPVRVLHLCGIKISSRVARGWTHVLVV